MNITVNVSSTPQELGRHAAAAIAKLLNDAIKAQGYARLVLSTGASQFETLDALVKEQVEWEKIEMFHLDEYVALPECHIASFRKYLKERFVSRVPLKAAYFVNGEGNVEKNIAELTTKLRENPIDVGVIGIGENGHIAFNDPPADFETDTAYKIVTLDERCRKQQVHCTRRVDPCGRIYCGDRHACAFTGECAVSKTRLSRHGRAFPGRDQTHVPCLGN